MWYITCRPLNRSKFGSSLETAKFYQSLLQSTFSKPRSTPLKDIQPQARPKRRESSKRKNKRKGSGRIAFDTTEHDQHNGSTSAPEPSLLVAQPPLSAANSCDTTQPYSHVLESKAFHFHFSVEFCVHPGSNHTCLIDQTAYTQQAAFSLTQLLQTACETRHESSSEPNVRLRPL